jgi:hypothetical protein
MGFDARANPASGDSETDGGKDGGDTWKEDSLKVKTIRCALTDALDPSNPDSRRFVNK